MSAWVKDGHEVTTEGDPGPGRYAGAAEDPPARGRRAISFGLTRAAPDFAVVDGRASVFFDGVQEGGPRDHRATGHIAGAHSVPFESVFTDDLKLKSPEELTALFAKASVKPGDTVIGYCHIGQQATAMLFAARALGHRVLLYDGSFEDWARRADTQSRTPQRSSHGTRTAARPYADPYMAGVGLGLVLLAAFVLVGRGLGASGAFGATATGLVSMVDAPRAKAQRISRVTSRTRRTVARVAALRNRRPDHRRISVGRLAGRVRGEVERGRGTSALTRLVFAFSAARPWASAPRWPADVPAVRH